MAGRGDVRPRLKIEPGQGLADRGYQIDDPLAGWYGRDTSPARNAYLENPGHRYGVLKLHSVDKVAKGWHKLSSTGWKRQ